MRTVTNKMPADLNPTPAERLDSWKEIAAYLKKGVRTVQRWERTDGLPVRRIGQDRAGSVFAYKAELDAWWQEQSRRLDLQPEPRTAVEVNPPPVLKRSSRWGLFPFLSLLALAMAAILWKTAPSAPGAYRPIPLTADHGWEIQPAFSPDGRQIAYVWMPPGLAPSIYVKSVGADSRVRLTAGAQPELDPAWSPDGRFIAFVRPQHSELLSDLILIPATGGPENQIAVVAREGGLSWSADGQWLIASDGPPQARSLVAISVATGAKHILTRPFEFGYSGAGLSPDSRRLVFCQSGPGASAVYELALGPGLTPQGEPRRLTSKVWARELLVTPDANEVIYTDDIGEGLGLWRLRLSPGAEPRLIHGTADRYSTPAISHNGRRLAFAVSRVSRVETWKKALSNPDAEPTPLLSSTHSDLNPQYSPDGRYIAFHSTRSGGSDIWVAASDGTNPRRLTFTNARTTATPRWSPDGEWIAFESNQTGQSEVYVVRSAGGAIRRLTDNPATDAIPSWSSDGRTLYFCSDRTGRYEIWKMPASGGPPAQVTYNGGFAAVESPDARYLYYSQTRNYGPVLRIPLAGGKAEPVIPDIRGLFFAVTTEGVYFQSKRTISFWDMASGRIHEVVTPSKPMGIGLAVSPDGRSLLYTQTDTQDGTDLYMIDGFR